MLDFTKDVKARVGIIDWVLRSRNHAMVAAIAIAKKEMERASHHPTVEDKNEDCILIAGLGSYNVVACLSTLARPPMGSAWASSPLNSSCSRPCAPARLSANWLPSWPSATGRQLSIVYYKLRNITPPLRGVFVLENKLRIFLS